MAALAVISAIGFSAPGARASSGASITPSAPVYWSNNGQARSELPNTWFVQLQSNPTIDGTSLSQVQSEQSAFQSAAQNAGVKYKVRYAYNKLWNGLALTLDKSQVGRLSAVPGVKAIYPVGIESLPVLQQVANPQDAFSLPMIGADIAQSELGYTGQGVKVGIIDTGIDYTHPDLGGCTQIGPGCRTAYGYDFVGDSYDSNAADVTLGQYNPVPSPDPDPMDCAGHGTHVAGIIGANGNPDTGGVVGVAPGVTFGAYRVFGCNGSTDDSVILTAMERAYADGMQIISMSLGDSFESWPQYPDAQAASRLVNHNVVVVAAAGNDGTSGTFATGAPSTGANVISVASYDNTHMAASSFTLNPSGTVIPYLPIANVPAPATSSTPTDPIVYVGRGCPADPAYGLTTPDPYLANPSGKTALIKRGGCSFEDKYHRAVAAGATTVLIYNNSAGLFNGGGVTPEGVNLAAISNADGGTIRSQIATTTTTLTWTNAPVNAPVPTAGLISSFSSYGLAADLTLKPDVGAPGGFIRSTWPVSKGSYASLSGTSMATPHVSGAVALLLQANPTLRAQNVRDILQNTANPSLWSLAPGYGLLDDVQRQGAGMIQIDKAIRATTLIQPGKLSLGASAAGPATNTLTFTNSASSPVTYNLSDIPAISTTAPELTPGFDWAPANVSFSSSSVTVPAGGTATVTVTISPNAALDDGDIYGGFLTFTPQGGGQVYHVPYAGYKGDYEAIQYLTTAPQLASVNPAGSGYIHANFPDPGYATFGYTSQPSGATYTMTDWQHVPYFLVHLAHPAAELKAQVFDATSGKSWQFSFDYKYLPKNSTDGGIFDLPWDGTTTAGLGSKAPTAVPNGKYIVKLTVTKALGDPNNPADVETWTSPVITIARPSGP